MHDYKTTKSDKTMRWSCKIKDVQNYFWYKFGEIDVPWTLAFLVGEMTTWPLPEQVSSELSFRQFCRIQTYTFFLVFALQHCHIRPAEHLNVALELHLQLPTLSLNVQKKTSSS